MKGNIEQSDLAPDDNFTDPAVSKNERMVIFCLGVGGLMLVPVFRDATGLPPFMGIMTVLAIIWFYTEILYNSKKNIEESIKFRVSKILKHIDMPTILFFFGILMAVAALQEAGMLATMATYLDRTLHNVYLIDGIIGFISSVVDNVPLVAGAMGMYSVDVMSTSGPEGAYLANFVVDGHFWQLLAYCVGTGGSIMIIGSAAGVVVMGLEKINFGWYLKKISLLAVMGYLTGIGVYFLQTLI